MKDDTSVSKEAAFQMAEYMVAHACAVKYSDIAAVVLVTNTLALAGALALFKLAGSFNLGMLVLLLSAPVTGLLYWFRGATLRWGMGGMWDKKPIHMQAHLNEFFDEMRQWQKEKCS